MGGIFDVSSVDRVPSLLRFFSVYMYIQPLLHDVCTCGHELYVP